MKFKVGDRVSIVHLVEQGIVVSIGNKVKVLLDDGFEESFFIHEIVSTQMDLPSIEYKDAMDETPSGQVIKGTIEVIDLHATYNHSKYYNLSSFEIVSRQLGYFHEEMQRLRVSKIHKAIFIHGKGTGTLRELLIKESKQYQKILVQIATESQYRESAIEIQFID